MEQNETILDLVQVINSNQIVASSRQVAEHFGKQHNHVLRDIEDIISTFSNIESKIGFSSEDIGFHKSEYNVKGIIRLYPEYIMNYDGFMLLTMGYKGKKALQWKLKYIKAFNQMKKIIHEQLIQQKVTTPSYQIEDPIARARDWIKEQEEKKLLLYQNTELKEELDEGLSAVVFANAVLL